MLKNYILLAWRNILRYRFYSAVNIIGLAVGILFVFLIGAYVWSEHLVNKNLRNAKNQYFLRSEWKDPNMGMDIITLGPLAKQLKETYPSLVKNYYRWDGITSVISKGDKHLREGIQLGDSTLLLMYGFELLHGDVRTALVKPFSVVLSRQMARKYFGREDVVGETISIQSFSGANREFAVTGVLKDVTQNSVTFLNDNNNNQIFIPTNTYTYFGRFDFDNWLNVSLPSYIELNEGVTAADLEAPIKKLISDNTISAIRENLTVKAVPLSTYYLEKNNGFVKRMLYALSLVGIFILLMAVVNFVNISISGSSSRMKEIGIRKVLGGLRSQIIIQFLAESAILVLMATLIAVLLYPFTSTYFGQLVGKEIPRLASFPVYFILLPAAMVMLVGLLAGLYPAVVISSLKSADSLKGKLKSAKEKVWLRKTLVGFQFSIAAIVMIAAVVVSQQVNYFFGKSLGYNKEYVVASQVPRNWTPEGTQKMLTVRNEFARMPEVQSVTLSYEIPNGMDGGSPLVYKSGTDSTQAVAMQQLVTDAHYLETYQVPLKAGNYFADSEKDSSKIVLNETAAKALGWNDPASAIHQRVRMAGSNAEFTIVGIAADFHFNSMQEKMRPNIFLQSQLVNSYRFLSFKLKPGNIGNTLDAIQKKWAVLLPGSSFEYSFMDQTLSKLYATELQLKKAATTATGLCLIIVLLGVLGLVSLSVQKRVKEIGIRKVVGASISDIMILFVREFVIIIAVSALVACPIAWLLMNNWLDQYNYRITMGPLPFLVTVGILFLITLLLIIGTTSRAARTNPVKSLRTE